MLVDENLAYATDALAVGNFKSGTLAALLSIAESLNELKQTQSDIKDSLTLTANLAAFSMGITEK